MIDLEQALANDYDYVIVGAGSAGCVIARRLVDNTDANVLLLESDDSENIGLPHEFGYYYEPTTHVNNRTILLPRGKVSGGVSSINATIWARGHKADYDGWANAGSAGWDYESVLPLFKKTEDWEDGASKFRGAGGPIHVERAKYLHPVAAAFLESGRSIGMRFLDDINAPEPEGIGSVNLNVRHDKYCSTCSTYLRPALKAKNLTVLTGAKVVQLNLSGTRCTGLTFEKDDRSHSVHVSQEVILSAGAIETPRLLMLSGIGPHEELKRLGIPTVLDLPGVGQNFQDHVIVAGLCFEAKQSLAPLHHNLSDSAAFCRSRSHLSVPDLMFLALQTPYVTDAIQEQHPVPENSFCIIPSLVRVHSRGYLRMRTAEHDGPLQIQPNFLSEQGDVDALLTAIEIGLDLASQPACRDLIKKWVAPTRWMGREMTRNFLRNSCSSYFHPAGTCAMGSGKEAVVDSQLLVHGIDSLRIADASIMPTLPSAPTNASCVMIGEFASRLVIADQRESRRVTAWVTV
jgi:choline dehydrogenase-like flavoprotein